SRRGPPSSGYSASAERQFSSWKATVQPWLVTSGEDASLISSAETAPSARCTAYSALWPSWLDENTRPEPSGSQSNPLISDRSVVSRRIVPPLVATEYRSEVGLVLPRKAIRRPSGEKRGYRSTAVSATS